MTPLTKSNLPLTFRAEEVKQILQAVNAGDSCLIVGIGSVGKSNLLRFLLEEEVHRPQLGDCLFIYVDLNKILKISGWGLLELMLHQLVMALTNRKVESATLESIAALHQKATAPQTRMLTLRYLDQALNMVCNGLGLRLVFLFDEFDELCRKLTPRGFAALRALRDEYKYSLMYIVATRLALKRLREQVVEMEPFEELVSPQTIWLGPYARQDAEFMLQRLAARHNVSLDEAVIEQILQITGRHSGLLRESYNMARKHSSDLFQALVESAQVVDECQRIWFSLSPEEQQVMVHLVGDTPPLVTDPATAGLLQQKGLLNDKNQIFSPLFAAYIQQQHPQVGARIHLDPSRQKIFVDGREIRNLPPLEYKLMAYLVSKRGHVCSRDELLEHLYPEDALDGGGSDSRLAAVVKRLRKHVEPNRKDPKYIITVHGRGFRLVDGE